MNIIYLLLAISLVLVALIVALFIWTVKSGQYDDLDKPSFRILAEDDALIKNKEKDGDTEQE